MVNNHPFVDANKRTAWLMTTLLIARSGYDLNLEPTDRIDDLVVDVAQNVTSFDDLVEWFRARLIKQAG